MKTFFVLILSTILTLTVYSQEVLNNELPLINGKVTYSGIIKIDSLSKDEIYQRVRLWLAYNYDNIKLDTKERIICLGHTQIGNAYILQTITIWIKEGSYKYEITNFQITQHIVMNGTSEDIDEPLEKYHSFLGIGKKFAFKNIDNQIVLLIKSLDTAIKTKTTDNW